jgi:hypothetical protein
VDVNVEAIIASYQVHSVGESAPLDLDLAQDGENVVQAAAPSGSGGALTVTGSSLDLGNSLVGLTGAPGAPPRIGSSPCDITAAGSVSTAGRGGLRPSAGDPLWSDLADVKGAPVADSNGGDVKRSGADLLASRTPNERPPGSPSTAQKGCALDL